MENILIEWQWTGSRVLKHWKKCKSCKDSLMLKQWKQRLSFWNVYIVHLEASHATVLQVKMETNDDFWPFIYRTTAFWGPENAQIWETGFKVQVFEHNTINFNVNLWKWRHYTHACFRHRDCLYSLLCRRVQCFFTKPATGLVMFTDTREWGSRQSVFVLTWTCTLFRVRMCWSHGHAALCVTQQWCTSSTYD